MLKTTQVNYATTVTTDGIRTDVLKTMLDNLISEKERIEEEISFIEEELKNRGE